MVRRLSPNLFTAEDFQNGVVLLVNKPLGYTSFQVVNKLRWAIRHTHKIKEIKVGHAGTLDPLATGLLVVCTGKKTKEIDQLMATRKVYTGTLVLGATTASYDLETPVEPGGAWEHLNMEILEQTAGKFTGEIMQQPPIFSAIKQGGKPLYELARKGEEVEIPSRPTTIYHFHLGPASGSEVAFEVACSKGTYIRSLVHDFGAALGCGAYLKTLCRTESGDLKLADAWELDELVAAIQSV